MSLSVAAARKRRRIYMVLGGLMVLAMAAALILTALEENIVFFYGPSEVKEKQLAVGQSFRLGGLVEENSYEILPDGVTHRFAITDGVERIEVRYKGLLPDLFREGQGVVTEGVLQPDQIFAAREVLAKHDENYMPKEVADALKKAGTWQGDGQDGDGAAP